MALDLATLQARRDTLKLAILTGQTSVAFEDRRVQYRSVSEMFQTLHWVNGEIEKLEGTVPSQRSRQIRMVTRDGW